MKVAAYQAPLEATGSTTLLDLLRGQVEWCEANAIEILCLPEGVLGGLADYSTTPAALAIDVESGALNRVLAPLSSLHVTTIVGFTEIDRLGRLYNSAALLQKGSIAGLYRKRHPAINRSVYAAGNAAPVFTVGDLTFGILICRDSTFDDPVQTMVAQGAAALFIPTNNGLPAAKASPGLIDETREQDVAMARRFGVAVIRADVAGRTDTLTAYGSSSIVDHQGTVLRSARLLSEDLLVAEPVT